jgi:hypothetical protein
MATANANVLQNGAKLVGEAVIPGASLLMDGEFGRGALHTVAAVLACAALGPVGAIAVAANSYSGSITGSSLLDRASKAVSKVRLPAKTVPAPEAVDHANGQ